MNLKNLAARATRKFALKLVEVQPLNVASGMVTCGNHSVRDVPDFTTIVRSDDGTRDVEGIVNSCTTDPSLLWRMIMPAF